MGATPTYGWPTPDPTDLVTNGPADIDALAQGIDASLAAEAQARADADALAVPRALVDAEGDLIIGTAADAVARLPKGAPGSALVVDAATGDVMWGMLSSGPHIEAKTTAGLDDTETVTFSQAFAAVPNVNATPYGNYMAGGCIVTSKSTTAATTKSFYYTGSGWTVPKDVQAIDQTS